jgi:DNA end-binding protein Ku
LKKQRDWRVQSRQPKILVRFDVPKIRPVVGVVRTNREHIIALEPLEKGLVGARCCAIARKCGPRRNSSTRSRTSKSPRNARSCQAHREPEVGAVRAGQVEDHYEIALVDLIKRSGKQITAKERPRGENVVDLMDALRKSLNDAGKGGRLAAGQGPQAEEDGIGPARNVDGDFRQGRSQGQGSR